MSASHTSRRLFLQWSAGSAVYLPLHQTLAAMSGAGAGAAAQPGKRPMRLFVFHTPMGTFPRLWTPTNVGPTDGNTPLVTSNPTFNLMHGPLESWRHKIVLAEGLSFPDVNANHAGGIRDGLTCGGADSYDVAVVQALQQQGITTYLPALHLGAGVEFGSVLRQNGQAVDNLFRDPKVVYETLFGQLGTANADATIAKRREIMRAALQQQNSMLRTITPEHQLYKLDQHLLAIEQLGKAANRCDASLLPMVPGNLDATPNNPNTFAQVGQLHMALAVQAFACDLTRVVTMQWGHETYEQPPRWLNPTWSEPLHGTLSHQRSYASLRKFIDVEVYWSSQFASLLEQLQQQADPLDPGRNLLDNTLVVWTRALGDSEMHSQYSVSYCLAGATERLGASKDGKHVHFGGLEQINSNAADISQPWQPGMPEPMYGGQNNYGPGRANDGQGWKARLGSPHLRLFRTISQILQVETPTFGKPTSYPSPISDPNAVAMELLS